MNTSLTLTIHIEPRQAGAYFTVPFQMPANTECFNLSYHYHRHQETEEILPAGSFIARKEINIIDLGLIAPDHVQVGASGSDKSTIQISTVNATPGYRPYPLLPGEWQIIVGAYKVAPEGVSVTYDLTFQPKSLRLLKGDFHTHTLASDGVLTLAELGQHGLRHGLDFLAITDHNQMVSRDALPHLPGLTLIPGIEWTHFQGHANFLGVDKPYDEPFIANSLTEVQARFNAARERGALITINHPYEAGCSFQFDINALPFDCLEIWNGPMRESNLRALGLWQNLLMAGKKIPLVGGSDYHHDQLFLILGGPTTCVYAMSASPADILAALRQGHAFITFAPEGPSLEMNAGTAIMGDTVAFSEVQELQVVARGLQAGDVLQLITPHGNAPILKAETAGSAQVDYTMPAPGFARLEIWRNFLPGVPLLPALISNPIYFD